MNQRKERDDAIHNWARKYYYMLQGGMVTKEVKRLMYDDKKTQDELSISESVVDSLWQSIALHTFVPREKEFDPSKVVSNVTVVRISKESKIATPKPPAAPQIEMSIDGNGKKKYYRHPTFYIVHEDRITQSEIARYETAAAASRALRLSIGSICNYLNGKVKNLRYLLRKIPLMQPMSSIEGVIRNANP